MKSIVLAAKEIVALQLGTAVVYHQKVSPQPEKGWTWGGWIVESTAKEPEIGNATWHEGARQMLSLTPPCQTSESYWVKETWAEFGSDGAVWYRAGIPEYKAGRATGRWFSFPHLLDGIIPPVDVRWKPSSQMPQWASRYTVSCTDIVVLQDEEGAWWWKYELMLEEEP